MRKVRGAIMLFTLPNQLDWPRLGLAVSGRVGGSVRRNAWKRMVREAFRLRQHELARAERGTGYDVVVSIRAGPDQPVWPLAAVMKALTELVGEADREWRRRERRDPPPDAAGAPRPANNPPT